MESRWSSKKETVAPGRPRQHGAANALRTTHVGGATTPAAERQLVRNMRPSLSEVPDRRAEDRTDGELQPEQPAQDAADEPPPTPSEMAMRRCW